MIDFSLEEKLLKATGVICRQGMVQFPVSDTAVAIIGHVVGNHEAELDLICAFSDTPSQTMEQLKASSGFTSEKIDPLSRSLAKKRPYLQSTQFIRPNDLQAPAAHAGWTDGI